MAEFSPDQIGLALTERNPRGIDYFIQNYSTAYYTFCLKLCLEQPKQAQYLFSNAIEKALKDKSLMARSADIWFYQSMHDIWFSFSRSRKELKEQTGKFQFNWTETVGRQQSQALLLLTPLEREIVLYRFSNKFSLHKIVEITGMSAEKILESFNGALEKISNI